MCVISDVRNKFSLIDEAGKKSGVKTKFVIFHIGNIIYFVLY
jgi:hypothetical protein